MQKEIDCFVTHDPVSSSDPEASNVDEYVGAVWSVEVYRPIAFSHPSDNFRTDGFPCAFIKAPATAGTEGIEFWIEDTTNGHQLQQAVDDKVISEYFEVTISTTSTTYVRSGATAPTKDDVALLPGQSYYVVNPLKSTISSHSYIHFQLSYTPDASNVIKFTPQIALQLTADGGQSESGVKIIFREKAPVAYVVNSATAWIMAAYADAPVDLEVGDRVRMGATTLGGFTDYCTVLEKVPITHIGNGIYGVLENTTLTANAITFNGRRLPYSQPSPYPANQRIEKRGVRYASDPVLIELPSVAKFPYEANAHDTAWYAYRISANVNCTLPPVEFTSRAMKSGDADSVNQRLVHRAAITFDDAWASKGQTARKPGERRRFFPCFRLRNDLSKPLVVPFGHTVKCIHEVKLHSYSLLSATQDTEYQHGHELNPTNWVAMELAGVQGEVMSNNPHANGAFAILHAGQMHNDTSSGINEHYETHPQGLVKVKFERPISTMRELRVSFRNPKGEAPRAARIHLWFKLWVTQG